MLPDHQNKAGSSSKHHNKVTIKPKSAPTAGKSKANLLKLKALIDKKKKAKLIAAKQLKKNVKPTNMKKAAVKPKQRSDEEPDASQKAPPPGMFLTGELEDDDDAINIEGLSDIEEADLEELADAYVSGDEDEPADAPPKNPKPKPKPPQKPKPKQPPKRQQDDDEDSDGDDTAPENEPTEETFSEEYMQIYL